VDPPLFKVSFINAVQAAAYEALQAAAFEAFQND